MRLLSYLLDLVLSGILVYFKQIVAPRLATKLAPRIMSHTARRLPQIRLRLRRLTIR